MMGYTPVDGLYEYLGLRICYKTLEIFINSGLIALLFIVAIVIAIYKTAKYKTFSKPLVYMLYFWIIYALFILPSSSIKRQPSLFEEIYPKYRNKNQQAKGVKTPYGMSLAKDCIDGVFKEIAKIILPKDLSHNYMNKIRVNLIREAISISEPALILKIKKFKNTCYKEALSRIVIEKKELNKEMVLNPFSRPLKEYYSQIKVASKDKKLKPEIKSCSQIFFSLVEDVKEYLKNNKIYKNYQKEVSQEIPKDILLGKIAQDVIKDELIAKNKATPHLPGQINSAIWLVKNGLNNIKGIANGSFEIIWIAPYVYGVCMAILLTLYPFFAAFALLPPFYKSLLYLLQIYLCLKICPIIWFIVSAVGGASLPPLAVLLIIILSPVLSFLLLGRMFLAIGLGFTMIYDKIYRQS